MAPGWAADDRRTTRPIAGTDRDRPAGGFAEALGQRDLRGALIRELDHEVAALIERAVDVGGVHAIEFAQARVSESRLQPDPIFLATPADDVTRVEVLKDPLGVVV